MRIAEVYRPSRVCRPVVVAARCILAEGVGALGVHTGGRLVRIVSDRDLVRAVADSVDPHTAPVAAYAAARGTASLNEYAPWWCAGCAGSELNGCW